MGGTNLSDPG